LVELRETVQEIVIPSYVEAAPRPKPLPFAHIPDSELSGYGVPPAWIPEVKAADEDTILVIAAHLPAEAAEAVLDLAVGAKPKTPVKLPAGADPFTHPDALRRFRVMGNVEELARALDFPWEKWIVFLHPEQRQLVERDHHGPARVSGSAGTGKTIVALHRAAFLARQHPDSRVLLTTRSRSLANALASKLRRLIASEPRLGERIEVYALDAIGKRLFTLAFGSPQIAARDDVRQLLRDAAAATPGLKFSLHFLETEWDQVVDAWQLDSWESYRDVARLGRKTRLPEKQRALLWSIFERVRSALSARGLITHSHLFTRLASHSVAGAPAPFDFVVVDEAQDIGIAQLRFLAALGANRPNSAFFAGDLGQRIFQQPFSWKALGVDVRGRSATLKVNYRTSYQIRMHADRLLGPEVADVDGNREERRGTVSLFNGPVPDIRVCDTKASERAAVAEWLAARLRDDSLKPNEIGVFVRSAAQIGRARAAASEAACQCHILDERVDTAPGQRSRVSRRRRHGLR
jgi:superfamily I DNA/RNA helicase